jgi:benzoyl-CoA reductase/2-hydroxyglutaryl-CoA dehydratase subunit BcrC/BadD/HgdB
MAERDVRAELKTAIDQQIAKMRAAGGLESMNYFYDRAKNMYDSDSESPLVGVFCNLVPEELIMAAGGKPVRICGGFHGSIGVSERVLPQVFCPLIKSSVGFFMSDMLSELKMIVVPTTCDGKKKAAEFLAEKKKTVIMEVPHTIESPQARELWLVEIKKLKKNIEKELGAKISRKKLRGAIEKTNRKRKLLLELYNLRKNNAPILGSDALLVAHTSFNDDLDSWMSHTESLLAELKTMEPRSDDRPRIMLTGSPILLPTWKIPLLIEEAQGNIIMDDLCSGAKTLLSTIEVRAWTMYDMLIGLADHYLMSACPCFVPNDPRVKKILNYVDEYRIDGVVYHNLQGCQLYGGEVWRVEKELKDKKIPMLKLETSYGEGDVKQLKIRVDAFMEMLESNK